MRVIIGVILTTFIRIPVSASFYHILGDSSQKRIWYSGFEIYVLQNNYGVLDGSSFQKLHHRSQVPDFGHTWSSDFENGIQIFTTDTNGNISLSNGNRLNQLHVKENYLQFYYYKKVELVSKTKWGISLNGGISYSFSKSYIGALLENGYYRDTFVPNAYPYYQSYLDTMHQLNFYRNVQRIGFHISAEYTYKMNPALHPPTNLTVGIRYNVYAPILDETIVAYRGYNENTYPYGRIRRRGPPVPTFPVIFRYDQPYAEYYAKMYRKKKPFSDLNLYFKFEFLITKRSTLYFQGGCNMYAKYRTGSKTNARSGALYGFGLCKKIY